MQGTAGGVPGRPTAVACWAADGDGGRWGVSWVELWLLLLVEEMVSLLFVVPLS